MFGTVPSVNMKELMLISSQEAGIIVGITVNIEEQAFLSLLPHIWDNSITELIAL